MRLRGDQLDAHLKHPLQPVYAIYGDDPLLVIEACDALRRTARQQGFDEREVLTVLPDFNWSALIHAAADLSLFGRRKLIDLRVPTGKVGREGSAAIQEYCKKNPSSDTVLLITLPTLEWAEEKAAWFTTLAESGVVIKLTSPALHELPDWIARRLKRQGQEADREGLRFIAEHVQGNLLAAHQEILKIGLLYPPETPPVSPENSGVSPPLKKGTRHLTLPQVRDAVLDVARFDIDALREALLAGHAGQLARALQGLMREGEALPLVLWAMTEEIRALCHVRSGLDSGKPLDLLLKEARVWGARQTAFRRAVQRISAATARAALIEASHLDRLFKGLESGNIWDRLLRLGLRLCVAA